MRRRHLLAASAALAAAPFAMARAQAKTEITLSRQPGILYLPTHVIEKQGLLEKHAAKLGLSGVTTKWLSFANGGTQQDTLLSGGVDIINTGTGQLLLLWDRTKGGVKGIVASSSQPLLLITRDPHIQKLEDFGPGDRIAVPTVRVSTQAILLQIAAARMYGRDNYSHFDAMTVQMGHPDAAITMSNASNEVRSHFSAPPFQANELHSVPGARVVADSASIIGGGGLTQGQFFCMTKFASANPVIIQALRHAAEEAKAFIEAEPKTSMEIYREITGDTTSVERLLALLAEPGMNAWDLQPKGTMVFAEHLAMIGTLKNKPSSWKDYYLPEAHDLAGS